MTDTKMDTTMVTRSSKKRKAEEEEDNNKTQTSPNKKQACLWIRKLDLVIRKLENDKEPHYSADYDDWKCVASWYKGVFTYTIYHADHPFTPTMKVGPDLNVYMNEVKTSDPQITKWYKNTRHVRPSTHLRSLQYWTWMKFLKTKRGQTRIAEKVHDFLESVEFHFLVQAPQALKAHIEKEEEHSNGHQATKIPSIWPSDW